MPKRISKRRYIKDFSDNKTIKENTVRNYALKYALETRKFEIELYWKRATYFWAFIAATFGGYFLLLDNQSDIYNNIDTLFLVNCLGLSFSVSWYLANRGSKFWQKNWEQHVDWLENKMIGPLFKTTLDKRQFKFKSLNDGYGFSVSKINQLLSLFVILIWLFLGINTIIILYNSNIVFMSHKGINILVLAILTLSFIFALLKFARTDQEDKYKQKNYFIRR